MQWPSPTKLFQTAVAAAQSAALLVRTTLFPSRVKSKGPYSAAKPPPDGCRFYVAIAHDHGGPAQEAILALTRTRMRPPWVMGEGKPAIHAFCYWREPGGAVWRLDAQAPNAVLTKISAVTAWRGAVQAWECLGTPEGVKAAILQACELDGAPYDFPEAFAQTVDAVDTLDFNPEAYICTHMTLKCARKCGPGFEVLAAKMPDWLPERCGRDWQANPGLFGPRVA